MPVPYRRTQSNKDPISLASLVAQWWRICFPMQETWVQSLIWEDPTCHGATEPLNHNYWACAPLSPPAAPTEACMPLILWSTTKEALGWEAHTLQLETSPGLSQLEKPHVPMKKHISSVQFISVTQSCPTLCDPMNPSTPGLPVHHQLLEFTQTQVHQVSDAIQPSHPLSSPSPPAPNPSQHQSLFQWVNSSHEVAKVLEFQL